jgi:MFS family permease
VITVALGWQWIFFINVPAGAVILLLSPVLLREQRTSAGEQARGVDVPGTVIITCGIALLIYTITEASQQGWGSPRTLGGLCIVMVLVAAFALVESRAGAPIAASIAQRVITRFGHRPVGHAGLAMLCISDAGLAATTALGGSPVAIAGCMLLFGLGMGCAFVPGTIASLEGVPDEDSGIAAAIQNTSFGLGTTLGVAILSAISAAAIPGPRPGGQGYLEALASGYRMAFIGGALLCALGLAVSTAVQRRPIGTGCDMNRPEPRPSTRRRTALRSRRRRACRRSC